MKKIFWLAPLLLLLAIQLIRPNMKNPPVDPAQDLQAVANPPAEVMTVLKAACYDCHSNETKYPWYSQVAPVSWWVANHINEGREKLNFSTFGALSAKDRSEAMEESGEQVQKGEMPMESYTWMHPEAKLSPDQRKLLEQWFNANGGEGGEGGNGAEGTNNEASRENKDDD